MSEEEDRRRLDASLERLRAEMENADAATRERIKALIERVERQLAKGEEKSGRAGLLEELQEDILHFEVEHPRLTAIVNELMLALSNMGI